MCREPLDQLQACRKDDTMHRFTVFSTWILIAAVPLLSAADGRLPGDDCAAATYEVGALPFADSGTTAGASNAINLVGPGPCLGVAFPTGPDVVYRIKVDVACSLFVTETPGSAWDAAVWVVTDCADPAGSCIAYGDSAGPGGAESLTFSPTPGTDYFLVVDGWSGNSGDYTLDITEIGAAGCSFVPVELTAFEID
jgi:hypothetical protein